MLMSSDVAAALAPLAFTGLMILAALNDIASFRIPNWIPAALAILFVPAAFVAHLPWSGWQGVGLHLAVGALALALAVGGFAMGWMGGGDAKLLAAAAVWLGPERLWPFAMATALAGGALALALVALRSTWLRPIAAAAPAWTQRLATPGEGAPYGVAIAAGALAAFAAQPLT